MAARPSKHSRTVRSRSDVLHMRSRSEDRESFVGLERLRELRSRGFTGSAARRDPRAVHQASHAHRAVAGESVAGPERIHLAVAALITLVFFVVAFAISAGVLSSREGRLGNAAAALGCFGFLIGRGVAGALLGRSGHPRDVAPWPAFANAMTTLVAVAASRGPRGTERRPAKIAPCFEENRWHRA